MLRSLLVVLFVLGFRVTTALAAPSAAGTWVGEVEGERVVVILGAGGRATIDDAAASWRQDGVVVRVQAGDGTVYQGKLDGAALGFTVAGATVAFRRVGKAPVERKRRELAPAKLLPGKRVKPEGTELSFVVPKGWSSGWETRDKQEVFVIAQGKDLAILASARQLASTEASLGPAALLERWASGHGLATVEPAIEFTVKGQPGAIVVRDQAKPAMRMFASVVIVDGWGIVMIALAPPAKATLVRTALETLLATLEGKVPAPAATGGGAATTSAPGLVGCWTSYESFGRSGSTTRKVIIAADGSYSWTGRTSYSGAGSSRSTEVGTWAAKGTQIEMVPRGGKAEVYTVRLGGSTLHLGTMKFNRCSG